MQPNFASRLRTWAIIAVILPLLVVHRVAFWFDGILFPSLKRVRVSKPLFIVGIPRSGTTMMHRLVAENGETFTTPPLWEVVLAPALCEKYLISALISVDRAVGRPLGRFVDWLQRRLGEWLDDVHPTTLESPEEDYLGLMSFGGCFLSVLAFPLRDSVWRLVYFQERPGPKQQRRLLDVYRGLLARHLRFRGEHLYILSKNPSFTSWVPALAAEFPDACFIGLRRDLKQSLPSQLSSMRDGFACFGYQVNDRRIVERFHRLFVDYWKQLERYGDELPADRFQQLEYASLRDDPCNAVIDCLERFGYAASNQTVERLNELGDAARRYRSRHRYALAEFGLTERMIDRSLASAIGSDQANHDSGPQESLLHDERQEPVHVSGSDRSFIDSTNHGETDSARSIG
jgi:hypothetical protein